MDSDRQREHCNSPILLKEDLSINDRQRRQRENSKYLGLRDLLSCCSRHSIKYPHAKIQQFTGKLALPKIVKCYSISVYEIVVVGDVIVSYDFN